MKIPYEYGCARYLKGKTYEEKMDSLVKKVVENPAETKDKKSKAHKNSESSIPDYFDQV
jgi:hypothetical protein